MESSYAAKVAALVSELVIKEAGGRVKGFNTDV